MRCLSLLPEVLNFLSPQNKVNHFWFMLSPTVAWWGASCHEPKSGQITMVQKCSCPDFALFPGAEQLAVRDLSGFFSSRSTQTAVVMLPQGSVHKWRQRQCPLLWCGMGLCYSPSLHFHFVTVIEKFSRLKVWRGTDMALLSSTPKYSRGALGTVPRAAFLLPVDNGKNALNPPTPIHSPNDP